MTTPFPKQKGVAYLLQILLALKFFAVCVSFVCFTSVPKLTKAADCTLAMDMAGEKKRKKKKGERERKIKEKWLPKQNKFRMDTPEVWRHDHSPDQAQRRVIPGLPCLVAENSTSTKYHFFLFLPWEEKRCQQRKPEALNPAVHTATLLLNFLIETFSCTLLQLDEETAPKGHRTV